MWRKEEPVFLGKDEPKEAGTFDDCVVKADTTGSMISGKWSLLWRTSSVDYNRDHEKFMEEIDILTAEFMK